MTWDSLENSKTFEADFSPFNAELKEGQLLGKNKNYRLEKLLGVGGMGEVWLAAEILDGAEVRKVVVKTLRPDRRGDEGAQEKALKQFQLIQSINHQHICPIYAIEQDPACGYLIVMGYANGGSYADWFKEQPKENGGIPLETVCDVLRPIAKALDYAHEVKNVIHRDVKPENMMFTTDGLSQTSWIIDFGIATNLRSETLATSGQFSQSGTASYMAPEQRAGELQTAQTDEYSLALVALEFLTGTTFIQGTQLLPQKVQQVMVKALALNPADRYETCREFIDALEGTLRGTKSPFSLLIHRINLLVQNLSKAHLKNKKVQVPSVVEPTVKSLKKFKWALVLGLFVVFVFGSIQVRKEANLQIKRQQIARQEEQKRKQEEQRRIAWQEEKKRELEEQQRIAEQEREAREAAEREKQAALEALRKEQLQKAEVAQKAEEERKAREKAEQDKKNADEALKKEQERKRLEEQKRLEEEAKRKAEELLPIKPGQSGKFQIVSYTLEPPQKRVAPRFYIYEKINGKKSDKYQRTWWVTNGNLMASIPKSEKYEVVIKRSPNISYVWDIKKLEGVNAYIVLDASISSEKICSESVAAHGSPFWITLSDGNKIQMKFVKQIGSEYHFYLTAYRILNPSYMYDISFNLKSGSALIYSDKRSGVRTHNSYISSLAPLELKNQEGHYYLEVVCKSASDGSVTHRFNCDDVVSRLNREMKPGQKEWKTTLHDGDNEIELKYTRP